MLAQFEWDPLGDLEGWLVHLLRTTFLSKLRGSHPSQGAMGRSEL